MAYITGFTNIKLGIPAPGAQASEIGFIYDENDNIVLSSQQAAVTDLTDNSGGTADDTIASITDTSTAGSADVGPVQDAIADLAAKVNELNAVLQAHGLTATP